MKPHFFEVAGVYFVDEQPENPDRGLSSFDDYKEMLEFCGSDEITPEA